MSIFRYAIEEVVGGYFFLQHLCFYERYKESVGYVLSQFFFISSEIPISPRYFLVRASKPPNQKGEQHREKSSRKWRPPGRARRCRLRRAARTRTAAA